MSQLNAGFVQPSYAEQVVDSYLQASLVFDFIETRWGFQPILDMLHGYRAGEATPELVDRLLGISMEELDESFDEHFQGRFGGSIDALVPAGASPGMVTQPRSVEDWQRITRENPGNFQARLALGIMLFNEDRLEDAQEHLRAALRLFPEYGGLDSPYWYLAQIHGERAEVELAVRALQRLTSLNESHYEALLKLGELQSELGRADESAAALDAAVLIYPYEIELHERLAEAHTERGDATGAVRERRAIVALAPADLAEAHYQLARAYLADGRRTEARRAVLRALEIAPSFGDALDLLLEVRSGATPGPDRRSSPGAPGAAMLGVRLRPAGTLVALAAVSILAASMVVAISSARRDDGAVTPATVQAGNTPYDGRFTFARLRYGAGLTGQSFRGRRGRGRDPGWAHDYPRAERNFMNILRETTLLQPYMDGGNIFDMDDPELTRYPLAYLSEPGMWYPSETEVEGL